MYVPRNKSRIARKSSSVSAFCFVNLDRCDSDVAAFIFSSKFAVTLAIGPRSPGFTFGNSRSVEPNFLYNSRSGATPRI